MKFKLPELILFLITLAVYSLSWKGAFFYDDLRQIIWNPSLQPGADILSIFWSPERRGRVLMNIFFAFSWKISHGAPWSFHVINTLIHLLNGWLAFLLLRSIFPKREALVFTSVSLFLLHPIQAEAVSHVMSLPTLLEASFFLGALVLRNRELKNPVRGRHSLWILPIFLLLAPFGKETGVLIPFVLLLWDLTVAKKLHVSGLKNPDPWILRLRYCAAFLAPLLWFFDSRQLASHGGVVGFHLYPMGEYLIVQLYSLWLRIALLVSPVNQSFYHEYPGLTGFVPLWSGLSALLCLGYVFFVYRRRKNLVLVFFTGFFIIAAAPYSTFLQYMNPFAEYRLYLSNLILFLGLSFLASVIWSRVKEKTHHSQFLTRVEKPMTIGALAVMILLSCQEQLLWADPYDKIAQSAANYPSSWRLKLMSGEQYERHGDFLEAKRAYLEGAVLNRQARASEHTLLPQILLIQLHEKAGLFSEALALFEEMDLQSLPHPRPPEYYQHLLYTLSQLGLTQRHTEVLAEGLKVYSREMIEQVPFMRVRQE